MIICDCHKFINGKLSNIKYNIYVWCSNFALYCIGNIAFVFCIGKISVVHF